MAASILKRAMNRARLLAQRRLNCFDTALPFVKDKTGLEIGGPSEVFGNKNSLLPIYDHVGSLDNCDVSRNTVWAIHSEAYHFSPLKKPGKSIFCDGSDLSQVADRSYEFILSSHNLEHIANPVKALREWQRVTISKGGLILVLPNYSRTFDHRRTPTKVNHMLEDFERNTPEGDLFHLPEILEAHDLTMDPGVKSIEEFRSRSLNNIDNRCLHHHVFNESNSRELLTAVGMDVLAVETAFPYHIFLIAQMA